MNLSRKNRLGFSLVELLAVVLILAVLAAVAIPLYINSRRASAARSCLGSMAAIAAAESAWSLRNGTYCYDAVGAPAAETLFAANGLVGAPEGLSAITRCPLNDGTDTYTVVNGAGGNCVITCPNAAAHQAVVTGYPANRTLAPPAAEAIP